MPIDCQTRRRRLIRQWVSSISFVLGRQSEPMPRVLRAWLGGSWLRGLPRACLILFLMIVVVGLLPDGVLRPGSQVSVLRRSIAIILPVLSIVGIWFAFWHTARIRRRVVNHEFTLCLECGYALTGLPLKGRCPECGAPYEVETVQGEWRRWFESHNPRDPGN